MNLMPLVLAFSPVLAALDEEFPDGDKLVAVSLLADREAVRPGGTLTLAVRYVIEKDWHIYWENPGDSGVKTRAKVTAPAGWQVGEARFPTPMRHESPGDIVTFGFERELVLLVDVKVPADARPGSIGTFEVEGAWLVCKELCVPGSGRAKVEIAVSEVEKPAHAALFDAARAKLPKSWSDLVKARLAWAGTEAEPRFTLVVPGATKLEWFPLDVEPVKLVESSVEVGKNGATLRAAYAFDRRDGATPPRIRGVLRVVTDAGEASYRLDHPYTPPTAGG